MAKSTLASAKSKLARAKSKLAAVNAIKPKPVEGWGEEARPSPPRIDAGDSLAFRFRATQTPPTLMGMVVFGTAPRVMSSVDGKKNVVSPAIPTDDNKEPSPKQSDLVTPITPIKTKKQQPASGDLSNLIDQFVPPACLPACLVLSCSFMFVAGTNAYVFNRTCSGFSHAGGWMRCTSSPVKWKTRFEKSCKHAGSHTRAMAMLRLRSRSVLSSLVGFDNAALASMDWRSI